MPIAVIAVLLCNASVVAIVRLLIQHGPMGSTELATDVVSTAVILVLQPVLITILRHRTVRLPAIVEQRTVRASAHCDFVQPSACTHTLGFDFFVAAGGRCHSWTSACQCMHRCRGFRLPHSHRGTQTRKSNFQYDPPSFWSMLCPQVHRKIQCVTWSRQVSYKTARHWIRLLNLNVYEGDSHRRFLAINNIIPVSPCCKCPQVQASSFED